MNIHSLDVLADCKFYHPVPDLTVRLEIKHETVTAGRRQVSA